MKKTLLGAAALVLGLGAPFAGTALAQGDPRETERLERESEEIAKVVESIRGLEFKGPVKKGIQNRDQLRKFVIEEMAKEMPDDKIAALQKAYVKLGFMKPGQDLKKILIDLYSEQIAGFYNPERKELFLIEHGGPEQAMLMAHELTHALQDQHFDLLPLHKGITDNDDRTLALTSVIEGDATVVMVIYTLRQQGVPLDVRSLPDIGTLLRGMSQLGEGMGGSGGEVMKSAPKVLTENMMFGYVDGASFCQKIVKKRGGSFDALTETFEDLPQSSEQILHPEKYMGESRDEPTEVTLPDVAKQLGDGWKLLVKNVMGEFNTRLLFTENGLPEAQAKRAAAGWDGDAWQCLEGPKGEVVFVWATEWDTENDAEEFEDAYEAYAKKGAGHAFVSVARAGTRVTIVDSDRRIAADDVVAKVAAAVKSSEGYAPIAANPFAALILPDSWTTELPADALVKRAAKGPASVEMRVIESDAAHPDTQEAALAELRRIVGSGGDGAGYVKVDLDGKPAGRILYTRDGKERATWIVVAGGKQHTLAVKADKGSLAAGVEALAKANPALGLSLEKTPRKPAVAAPGDAPREPARPRDPKREPSLF